MKASKIIATVLILATLCALLPSCSGVGRYQSVYYDLFDTVTVISGYANTAEDYNESVSMLHSELLTCHRLFDIYHEYEGINNLATVNKNAGLSPVTVDERIIELLSQAKAAYERTDGAVNVAMGALLKVWHKYRTEDNNELPSGKELEKAAEHISIDSLVIDPDKSTVYITDPEASLDMGALAKGYACDRAYKMLGQSGMISACINLGGNVLTYGEKPNGEGGWNVGIQSPDSEGYLFDLEVCNKSVVTSGDYHRYYTVDGKDYHHIIDPQTRYPATHYTQVTVICESSLDADILSTALFVLDLEKGERIADEYGAAVVWIEKDGTVRKNSKAEEIIEGADRE